MRPDRRWSATPERVRVQLSPFIALLAASLLLCCLVTVPDVAAGWPALRIADARLAGWVGVALVVALVVAELCLLAGSRVGSAPGLAFGVTAALLGLALAGDVASGAQAVLVLGLLALAVGALFAFGITVADELPPKAAAAALLGWLLPWAGGWGALAWFGVHGRTSAETRLGVHPPAWALLAGGAVLLAWAVLAITLEPSRRAARSRDGWEDAWAGLTGLVVGTGCLVMLVGFQPDLSPSWGRPVVLLVAAVVAAGLVLCGTAMPDVMTRGAYLAVVVTATTGPAAVEVMVLVSGEGSGSVSSWLLLAFAVAGVIGVGVGWRWSRVGVTTGLVLMALAEAGGWVLPANEFLMAAAAVPLTLGIAMAASAAVRVAAASWMALRFVATAGLVGVLLGQLAAPAVSWCLGTQLTAGADARPGGRVLLGLAFAVTVLAAAGTAVLQDLRRTRSDTVGPRDRHRPYDHSGGMP